MDENEGLFGVYTACKIKLDGLECRRRQSRKFSIGGNEDATSQEMNSNISTTKIWVRYTNTKFEGLIFLGFKVFFNLGLIALYHRL